MSPAATQFPETTPDSRMKRSWIWLGFILLVAGFLGHFFAARAIGGSYVAYRDHMVGFFGASLLAGLIIWGLGRRYWKGRPDITLLILGVVQALLGLFVYIERFNVHTFVGH